MVVGAAGGEVQDTGGGRGRMWEEERVKLERTMWEEERVKLERTMWSESARGHRGGGRDILSIGNG